MTQARLCGYVADEWKDLWAFAKFSQLHPFLFSVPVAVTSFSLSATTRVSKMLVMMLAYILIHKC